MTNWDCKKRKRLPCAPGAGRRHSCRPSGNPKEPIFTEKPVIKKFICPLLSLTLLCGAAHAEAPVELTVFAADVLAVDPADVLPLWER